MPKRIVVELSNEQSEELEKVRDRHEKAYMRERAAAVLKVASGETLTAVGEHGLLKRHKLDTIHRWIKDYLSQGLEGWVIKKGRGRKPVFFPKNERGS